MVIIHHIFKLAGNGNEAKDHKICYCWIHLLICLMWCNLLGPYSRPIRGVYEGGYGFGIEATFATLSSNERSWSHSSHVTSTRNIVYKIDVQKHGARSIMWWSHLVFFTKQKVSQTQGHISWNIKDQHSWVWRLLSHTCHVYFLRHNSTHVTLTKTTTLPHRWRPCLFEPHPTRFSVSPQGWQLCP